LNQPDFKNDDLPSTTEEPTEAPRKGLSQEDFERMAGAHSAPRCVHVKSNGVRCGSPAMHAKPWCYFHDRFYNRPYEDTFPALEDANAIQIALMQVLDGLRSGRIDRLTAQTFLYGLRIAAIVNRSANFNPHPSRIITEEPLTADRHSPAFIAVPSPVGIVPTISASAETHTPRPRRAHSASSAFQVSGLQTSQKGTRGA
jgi:hypothetical protein